MKYRLDPISRTVDDYAAWSPAESLVAYTHHAQTFEELQVRGDLQIFLFNLRTGDTTYVGPGWSPTWSSNGDTLGFVLRGQLHAHVLSADATFRVSGVGPCYSPRWSPSGGRLAFDTYYQAGGGNVIWTILSDGSDLTDISQHGVGEWRAPAWTPDGDSLLHYRYLTGVSGSELFIMALDGSGGRRLTFNDASEYDPTCSPDGRTIAFTRNLRGGSYGIYALDRVTGDTRRLFGGASSASWNSTGDSLIFSYWFGDRKTLWIGDAQGVRKRQLTY